MAEGDTRRLSREMRVWRAVRGTWLGRLVRGLPFLLLGRVLPAATALIGAYFCLLVLIKLDQDTTPITNAAFAIVATLAALSFSASRAVGGLAAAHYAEAGEEFLHAGLILLLASIIRYALFSLHEGLASHPDAARVMTGLVGAVVALLFGDSMRATSTAVQLLARALERRAGSRDRAALEGTAVSRERPGAGAADPADPAR